MYRALLLSLVLAAPTAGFAAPTEAESDHPIIHQSREVQAKRAQALVDAQRCRDRALAKIRTTPRLPRARPVSAPVPVSAALVAAPPPLPGSLDGERCAFRPASTGLTVVCRAAKTTAAPGSKTSASAPRP